MKLCRKHNSVDCPVCPPQRLTMRRVNQALAPYGFELVKGPGYFYFLRLPDGKGGYLGMHLYNDSVYVYKLNHLSLESWVNDLLYKMKESQG